MYMNRGDKLELEECMYLSMLPFGGVVAISSNSGGSLVTRAVIHTIKACSYLRFGYAKVHRAVSHIASGSLL